MIEISFDAQPGYVIIRVPVADWPPLHMPELEKADVDEDEDEELRRDLGPSARRGRLRDREVQERMMVYVEEYRRVEA